MRTITLFLFAVLTHAVAANGGQLGTVRFSTSAAPPAQPRFEQGLALLHSFQYEEAEQAFGRAAQQDWQCAMCHWGLAMVHYQQLSDWPSASDFARARQELARAQRIRRTTTRERAYIAAAATFFQSNRALTHAARIGQYSRQLDLLRRRFPTDVDATAFYALSLVALANEQPNPLPLLRSAVDVLEPLLQTDGNHPGVAHYLIHAADQPELAMRGLEAARCYADIAPDSSHALHMPSHIFVRLGLWDEAIALNLRAAKAGAAAMAEHRGAPTNQTHALDYHAYAYLQRGQE